MEISLYFEAIPQLIRRRGVISEKYFRVGAYSKGCLFEGGGLIQGLMVMYHLSSELVQV